MEGMNKVILLGNIGSDPELRFTQAGQGILSLRMATTESWFDKESQARKERTEWHNVSIWGARGEALAKILVKGSQIMVEGGLRTSSYDDREGIKRYKTEIVAREVYLCGGKRNEETKPQVEASERRAPAQQRAARPRAAPARPAEPRWGQGSAEPGSDFDSPPTGDGTGSDDDIPY